MTAVRVSSQRNPFADLNVKENVPLVPLTTWRVGGPARWFVELDRTDCHRLIQPLIQRARECGIPVYFLGRGSNVLVSDDGLDGLVICTRSSFQRCSRDGSYLVAEAGVPLPRLARYAADLGYAGYEFLIGIPGTVGGGVVINAGLTAQGRKEIADLLVDVEVIDRDGERAVLERSQLDLGYRRSALLDQGVFVVRARFRLDTPGDRERIHRQMVAHLMERRRKQPLTKATAGSTFKQPQGGKPAGWYIERAGLKGRRVGRAVVSKKHANWIVNSGGATAGEIKDLIALIRSEVTEKFGVHLEREVRYLPEDQDRC